MFNLSVQTNSEQAYLSQAVLVYKLQGRHNHGFVSIHGVQAGSNGRPVIMPGELASVQALHALFTQLQVKMGDKPVNHWIDDRLIYQDGIRTIWWTPAKKRMMFFDQKRMGQEIGKDVATAFAECPTPPMVWMAIEKNLSVWALAENVRPTQATRLYQAPFFNVFESGRVCIGTAHVPEHSSDLDRWEKAFFDSTFTHPNVHGKGRLIAKSDPWTFWYGMLHAPRSSFPKTKLVKTSTILEELTEG